MSESVFSTYWYRVARLKPALRDSTRISRHIYRGQVWYVLSNSLNGQNLRFNAAAYHLIGQLNGQRTVEEIWGNAGRIDPDNHPGQDEMIRLLIKLHDANLIQSDILPSADKLLSKSGRSTSGWKQRTANPFSVRFPLCDPDRFLDKWSRFVSPLLTRGAFIAWLLVMLTALVAAGMNWADLVENAAADRLLSLNNLALLWLTYPLVKVLHELGHAFAVKKWGGEIHEMGIMLLALTPIPYLDASASASFPDKRQRIAVAAMGMMVELSIAALALFVWLNVDTGLVSALAYNVMLIGGVSTVLFNGNPLLRYDGYYILADQIEIPNLAQRSSQYFGYLVQRYLLASPEAESPVTAPGEKGWFLWYGPISFCYRVFVLFGLIWLVSDKFFMIGVLIALWGVISLLLLPAWRSMSRFLDSPAARNGRARLALMAGCGGLLLLVLFAWPMPLWTSTQGVVWLPQDAVVRAGADLEIVEILAPNEQLVSAGTPLLRGVDPFLEAQFWVYRARLEELYATYNALPLHERVERKMLLDEIELVREQLRQEQAKQDKLVVCSPCAGRFILPDARNLLGHFIRQGEVLGYILDPQKPTIRAVVDQADIGLVRKQLTDIELRFAKQPGLVLATSSQRIIPSADLNLPSAALGTAGGGTIPVDPNDPDGLRALESHFQLELDLPQQIRDPQIGDRVHLRLEHGSMPLALQWYRSLKQLFLRKFYV
ncbi:MAG: peptidase M50 [Desulfuromonadales bacterium]|nr:peptidase M50 [Desulfuromonadales bacterium]